MSFLNSDLEIFRRELLHPTGATYADFIDLRYSANELNDNTMSDWQVSLNYVLGWLNKNEALI